MEFHKEVNMLYQGTTLNKPRRRIMHVILYVLGTTLTLAVLAELVGRAA